MPFVERAIAVAERAPLPDLVTRAGIYYLVNRTKHQLARQPRSVNETFARDMSSFPIAMSTAEANEQHYEIPASFFDLFLGKRRKYSCGFYDHDDTTLDEAEEAALALTAEHADIIDGQKILELGCGWGSLTLWLAEKFPVLEITAVSNSASQRDYIMSQAQTRGFGNVTVIKADMNEFTTTERFDRIVSVEMFEHMSNWHELIDKVVSWLGPNGRIFMHVFSHKSASYRFDHTDKSDWIAQHFFTGGIMPSHDLIDHLSDLVEVEKKWRWSGDHYKKTARDWLVNYDRNSAEIDQILRNVYGPDARLWKTRWRWFFLATMGLFGHDNGDVWGISHYRLKRASAR